MHWAVKEGDVLEGLFLFSLIARARKKRCSRVLQNHDLFASTIGLHRSWDTSPS